MDEFIIPLRPEDLAAEDCSLPIRVSRVTQLAGLPAADVQQYAESAVSGFMREVDLNYCAQETSLCMLQGRSMTSATRTRLA